MSVALAMHEVARLTELETQIERGLTTFVEVGGALAEIRDARLYRETHRNFTDYCRERWRMTPQHAGRLVASAEVIGNLEPIGSTLPETESQARPLASLEPEQQREAWREAVETAPNGKVTAAHVASVAQKAKERGEHPVTAARAVLEAPHAESIRRASRRRMDNRIRDLISAALAMRDVSDDDLDSVEANDLMADGLRCAIEQITRIISLTRKNG